MAAAGSVIAAVIAIAAVTARHADALRAARGEAARSDAESRSRRDDLERQGRSLREAREQIARLHADLERLRDHAPKPEAARAAPKPPQVAITASARRMPVERRGTTLRSASAACNARTGRPLLNPNRFHHTMIDVPSTCVPIAVIIARARFAALADGGEVRMPLGKAFSPSDSARSPTASV